MKRIRATVSDLRRRESGAALIEFALSATLLFTLMFGIVEFGLAFRDRLTITNATQGAARVGSALGNDLNSDLEVLKALEQSLATLPNSGLGIVRYVDIYHSDANGKPLQTCNAGGSAKCNRYLYHPGYTPTCDWQPCPDADAGYTGWGWSPDDRGRRTAGPGRHGRTGHVRPRLGDRWDRPTPQRKV